MGRQDPLTPFNHASFKVKAIINNVEQITMEAQTLNLFFYSILIFPFIQGHPFKPTKP